jgi:hypothetical protein
LRVVLYRCGTWFLTLGEDRRLEKIHNEKLHNIHSSPSIIRMIKGNRIRWAGHVARMGFEQEYI